MDVDALKGIEWIRAEDAGGSTAVYQSRQAIGEHLGWGGSWYSDEAGLGRLFDFLNSGTPLHTRDGRTRLALLDGLAGATDEGSRVAWVDTVKREAYWSVRENRYQPPEFSEPYGMNYRYDNLYEVYEWEDPAEPGTWISQEDADARISDRQQEQSLEGAAEPEAAWDENWQMLYRLGHGGVYEYAYSDDQQTVRPGTDWLTYDEAMQGTAPPTEAASQSAPSLDEETGLRFDGLNWYLPDGETIVYADPANTGRFYDAAGNWYDHGELWTPPAEEAAEAGLTTAAAEQGGPETEQAADASAGAGEPAVEGLPAPLQEFIAEFRALDDSYRSIPVSVIIDAISNAAESTGSE